jgi:WD40 repeat protein
MHPSGKLASGSSDGTICLWNLQTGQPEAIFRNAGFITSIAFSPDGAWMASGSSDQTIRIWEVKKQRLVRQLSGHTDVVATVTFSADGQHLVSGSLDGTARIWDHARGNCMLTYTGHQQWVLSLIPLPDGRILSGSRDQSIQLWDIKTGKTLRVYERERTPRKAEYGGMALKGNRLLWAGSDGMHLWDFNSGRHLRKFRSADEVASISPFVDGDLRANDHDHWRADGRVAVSMGYENDLRLWDTETGRCIRTIKTEKKVWRALFVDAQTLAVGVGEEIQLWKASIDPLAQCYTPLLSIPESGVEAVQKEAYLQQQLSTVETLLKKGQPKEALATARQVQSLPAFSHHDGLLALITRCGQHGQHSGLREWWSRALFHQGEFEGIGGVQALQFSPDGGLLAAGDFEGVIGIYDTQQRKLLTTLKRHTGAVSALVFLDAGRLLSMSNRGDVLLWSLASGKGQRVRTDIDPTKGAHLGTALSVDGAYLVLIGLEGFSLRPLSLGSGVAAANLLPLEERAYRPTVTRVRPDELAPMPAVMKDNRMGWEFKPAISPDGSLFTSTWGEAGRTGVAHPIRAWRSLRGNPQPVHTLLGHAKPVTAMAFSPSGERLASVDQGGALKLWYLKTGVCQLAVDRANAQYTALCFSPDGKYMLTGEMKGGLALWDLTGKRIASQAVHSGPVNVTAFSRPGRLAASGGYDNTIHLWEFDWEHTFPAAADWDESARPLLRAFLTLHTAYGADGLTRSGAPRWREQDFEDLIDELSFRGFGWVKPQGVRRELEKMAKER